MTNNPLQTEANTCNVPYHKDAQAFALGEGPCYWIGEKSFTRTDFIQFANGEVVVAEQLFSLISGQDPQKTLYKLVNEGTLLIPDYMSDGERTVLSFGGPPLPTEVHKRLLEELGWEALFPELSHPRLWTKQTPNVPVPQGIAFTDLIKRTESDTNESSDNSYVEEGNDHE
jgi:hypothetical protein